METVDLYPLRSYEPKVIRAHPRAADSWNLVTPLTAQILERLATLGIADPTSATEHYQRARELKQAARTVAAPLVSRAEIERQLASGDLTPDAARRQLAKLASPALAGESASVERETLAAAAVEAYRQSLTAFQELDDAAWLEMLREHTARALDEGDEGRWELLHGTPEGLHVLLRHVGALESLRVHDPRLWYSGDVTAIHGWRLARANYVVPVALSREGNTEYRVALVDPPRSWTPVSKWARPHQLGGRAPSTAQVTFRALRDHREDWRLGAYSAAEVLAQLRGIEAQHDRHIHNTRQVTA